MPAVLDPKPDSSVLPKRPVYATLPSTELADRWRRGEQAAATELFNRYFDQISGMVHGRINRRFSSRMSSDEIVQSAFGSVFRMARDRPQEFADDEAFRRWLITVVLNKAYKRIQHESAQKRDPRREQAADSSEGFAAFVAERLCEKPDNEGVLEMTELVERVSEAVSDNQRALIRLRLLGRSQKEIAAELGVDPRTVRRWSEDLDKRARAILINELAT